MYILLNIDICRFLDAAGIERLTRELDQLSVHAGKVKEAVAAAAEQTEEAPPPPYAACAAAVAAEREEQRAQEEQGIEAVFTCQVCLEPPKEKQVRVL